MSDKIKLPSNMRVCEGCGYFQALTNGNEIICAKLGRIPNGVAICLAPHTMSLDQSEEIQRKLREADRVKMVFCCSVEELILSEGTKDRLRRAGLWMICDVADRTAEELFDTGLFEGRNLEELMAAIQGFGLGHGLTKGQMRESLRLFRSRFAVSRLVRWDELADKEASE